MNWATIGIVVWLSSSIPFRNCLDNGLAITPPMGYNTWNAFHEDIDETMVRESAEILISSGLAAAGYTYFNLDDGWNQKTRGLEGPMEYNSTRFPSGIPALADWLHSKGLKLGVYSDAGSMTCAKFAASLGHEMEDAKVFAEWGVDFLKYDNCFATWPKKMSVRKRYEAMRDALNATGRPILFSMCEWGVSSPWEYGHEVGHTWRTTKDISMEIEATWADVVENLDETAGLARFAGPGGWNDADMLEVGDPGGKALTYTEQRAHFALWALIKSPLLIGADLRKLKREELLLLKSREIIAVNQDPLGVAGDRVWKQGPYEVWAAPLAGGARAVVLFNRHVASDEKFDEHNMTLHWGMVGYPIDLEVMVRDLYKERDIGHYTGMMTELVEAHGVLALKLTPTKSVEGLDTWRPWHCDPLLDANCSDNSVYIKPVPCPPQTPCKQADERPSVAASAVAALGAAAPIGSLDKRSAIMVLVVGLCSGLVLGFLGAMLAMHFCLNRRSPSTPLASKLSAGPAGGFSSSYYSPATTRHPLVRHRGTPDAAQTNTSDVMDRV
ncbi:g10048 [Coccomyxa elongata]